jgi:hypothetical protein
VRIFFQLKTWQVNRHQQRSLSNIFAVGITLGRTVPQDIPTQSLRNIEHGIVLSFSAFGFSNWRPTSSSAVLLDMFHITKYLSRPSLSVCLVVFRLDEKSLFF